MPDKTLRADIWLAKTNKRILTRPAVSSGEERGWQVLMLMKFYALLQEISLIVVLILDYFSFQEHDLNFPFVPLLPLLCNLLVDCRTEAAAHQQHHGELENFTTTLFQHCWS